LFTADIQSWLENFYAFSVSGTTYVYNIWYVLWDPDNIAGTAPGALPQGVIDFFQQLHGDGTNPGLIGSGTGQISKYEFFRGIYLFYRDYALYDYFKTNSATYCGSAYTYWDGDQDLDAHIDNGGYTLVFPKNLLFENFDPSQLPYDPTGGGTNPLDLTALGSDLCEQNCEAYANSWLEQLQSCTGSLTAAELLALKNDLITICTYGCDASNNYTGDVNGDGSQYIDYNGNFAYTFADVIDEFTTGCAVTVVHPPVAPANNTCNCTQLQDEITNNSLAVDPLNPTPAELTAITNHLNTAFSTSYVEADVQGWLDYCDNEETGVMDANFIQALECAPCKCDRLQEFADERGLATDPANPTTGEITTITAELNLVYGTSFTATEVTAFFSTCNNATPEPAVLVGFPEGLRCIPTVDTYDPAVIALNDCNEEAVKIANANTALLYNRALQTAIVSWLADYRTACWSDMASREAFQTTYELNEYYYTLYYYDQAGNLTKTVPPRGVRFHTTDIEDPQNPGSFISNPVFGDITSERQTPTAGTAPNYENHTMITNYRYDSYGQLRHQYTPDGGASQFWYDAVGRLVVSQDARQAALGTPRYSYTLYDELGRITEVGEVATTDAMTDDIALGISQAFTDYQDWLDGAGTRYQVTRTFYDAVLLGAVDEGLFFGPNGQQELRTRVASTTFTETILHAQLHLINNYDRALHYSYDIHGNVQTLVQEIPELLEFFPKVIGANHAPDAFRTDYVYDLVSGNVNEVHYQKGEPDQFFHRYCYDADNRLTTVFTSTDYETWSKDAKYQYYAHGPMARTELGDQQVQGLDYAYTLQGWLKGVNSSTAVATRDLGKDGDGTASNDQHRVFGQDAMGFSLRYYDGDYTPIDAASGDFVASINPTGTYGVAAPSLYNGNISAMVTALHNLDEKPLPVHGNAYRYDQLNRIKQSNVFHNQSWTAQGGGTYTLTDGVANTNSFSLSTDNGDYAASYTYDRNGNLLALNRNTAGTIHDYNAPPVTGQQQIDQLTYTYDTEANNGIRVNRLNHAADATSGNGGLPQGQLQNNYTYDEIGNLTADVAEGIASIEWTVYGKIAKINRVPGNASPDLEFYYGPDGNRWLKVVKPKDQTGTLLNQDQWAYTYYVRDAQGNVLGVYEKEFEDRGNGDYTAWLRAKERNLYGSSRLGLLNHPVDISSREFTAGIDPTSKAFTNIAPGTSTIFDAPTELFDRQVGLKRLELPNHLGNVLAVVSDRKLSQEDQGNPGTTDHYMSDVLAYNDYFPFGMLQPGRNGNSSSYRFGMNGMEMDNEVSGDGNSYTAPFWQYDARLGRRWNVDPIVKHHEAPYATFSNNPNYFIDPNGDNAGEYYSKRGVYLGSDGIDDGKTFIVSEQDFDQASCRNGEDCGSFVNDVRKNAIPAYGSGDEAAKAWAPSGFEATKNDPDHLERAARILYLQTTGGPHETIYALGNTVTGEVSRETGVKQSVDVQGSTSPLMQEKTFTWKQFPDGEYVKGGYWDGYKTEFVPNGEYYWKAEGSPIWKTFGFVHT
ncbi:MAG: hypothetical protein AAGB22_00845, partial [Bacteroidota bacterium]